MGKTKKEQLTIDGRDISLSNLDKILFPDGQVRKADVIDFYARMAEFLLPHLKDRPVTLKRYPNGALGEFFYEKDAPGFTPDWVETFPVPRRERGGTIRYILVNDRATLVWLANLANLEIHPFLHRVPHIARPTSIVFDLDPGEGADVLTCARVAFLIREIFEKLGLESFVKVSGSKGLQVYLPLNTTITYEATEPFAKAVAELLANEHPTLVVSDMAKKLRAKKVLVDWSQNAGFKTTISVYSLRAKSGTPFVSLPVTWEELEAALKKKKPESLYFRMDAALKRVQKRGDLFSDVLSLKQKLPKAFSTNAREAPTSLNVYAKKRDFSKTAEPAPTPISRSKQGSRRRFVIQKHAASHLHYDFRLEMHDVLKSWAVPKGPPYVKGERRLAMPTEDHPLDYFDFEGIIPKGQYGGGTVMVWDIGTYELIEGDYYQGRLRFHLNGEKLKGEWELVRWPKKEERETWLLIKAGKTMRTISKKRDDSSVLSERSMQEIADARAATWNSNRE
jgi:bifunctional non-homologous end joining protein LigD